MMIDSIDILHDEKGQPLVDTDGDFKITTGIDCFIQVIRDEAITQEGELFFDNNFGWSLLDFAQAEYDELVEVEIQQRIYEKLSKYEVIDTNTIKIVVDYDRRIYNINVSFKLNSDDTEYNIDLTVDDMEVKLDD